MPKLLLRIVAVLLVPCLMADPTLAAMAGQNNNGPFVLSPRPLFSMQALELTPIGARGYTMNLHINSVFVGALVVELAAEIGRAQSESITRRSRTSRFRRKFLSSIMAAGFFWMMPSRAQTPAPHQEIAQSSAPREVDVEAARQLLSIDWLSLTTSNHPTENEKEQFLRMVRQVLRAQGVDTLSVPVLLEVRDRTALDRQTGAFTEETEDHKGVSIVVNEFPYFGPNRATYFENHRFDQALWHESYHLKNHLNYLKFAPGIVGYIKQKEGFNTLGAERTQGIVRALLIDQEEYAAISYALYMYKRVVGVDPPPAILEINKVYMAYISARYRQRLGERLTPDDIKLYERLGAQDVDEIYRLDSEEAPVFKELFPIGLRFDPSTMERDTSELQGVARKVEPLDITLGDSGKTVKAYATNLTINELMLWVIKQMDPSEARDYLNKGSLRVDLRMERMENGRWVPIDRKAIPRPADQLRIFIAKYPQKKVLLNAPGSRDQADDQQLKRERIGRNLSYLGNVSDNAKVRVVGIPHKVSKSELDSFVKKGQVVFTGEAWVWNVAGGNSRDESKPAAGPTENSIAEDKIERVVNLLDEEFGLFDHAKTAVRRWVRGEMGLDSAAEEVRWSNENIRASIADEDDYDFSTMRSSFVQAALVAAALNVKHGIDPFVAMGLIHSPIVTYLESIGGETEENLIKNAVSHFMRADKFTERQTRSILAEAKNLYARTTSLNLRATTESPAAPADKDLISLVNRMWFTWFGFKTAGEITEYALKTGHQLIEHPVFASRGLDQGIFAGWISDAIAAYRNLPQSQGLNPFELANIRVIPSLGVGGYKEDSHWHQMVYVDEMGHIVIHEEFLAWLQRHTRSRDEAITYLAHVLGHENVERTQGPSGRFSHSEALKRFELSEAVEAALLSGAQQPLPPLPTPAKDILEQVHYSLESNPDPAKAGENLKIMYTREDGRTMESGRYFRSQTGDIFEIIQKNGNAEERVPISQNGGFYHALKLGYDLATIKPRAEITVTYTEENVIVSIATMGDFRILRAKPAIVISKGVLAPSNIAQAANMLAQFAVVFDPAVRNHVEAFSKIETNVSLSLLPSEMRRMYGMKADALADPAADEGREFHAVPAMLPAIPLALGIWASVSPGKINGTRWQLILTTLGWTALGLWINFQLISPYTGAFTWTDIIVSFFILFVQVPLHELGHMLAAKLIGIRILSIHLFKVIIHGSDLEAKQLHEQIFFILGGVLVQTALGLILIYLPDIITSPGVMRVAATATFGYALFNAIPIRYFSSFSDGLWAYIAVAAKMGWPHPPTGGAASPGGYERPDNGPKDSNQPLRRQMLDAA